MRRPGGLRLAAGAAVLTCLEPLAAGRSLVDVVRTGTGPVLLRTSAAEFAVGAAGCIEARLLAGNRRLSLDDVQGQNACAVTAAVDGGGPVDVALDLGRARVSELTPGEAGPGRRIEIPGRLGPASSAIEVLLAVEARDGSPNAVSTTWAFTNVGRSAVVLDRASVARHRLSAARSDPGLRPQDLWSFHGSSERVGQGEVVAVAPGFTRQNTFGAAQAQGVGGGVPVLAFWSPSVGAAVGHLAPGPYSLSMPVEVGEDGRSRLRVRLDPRAQLAPGRSFETPPLFHAVFSGDYYDALRIYAKLLESGAGSPRVFSPESYETSWCSWGFGEDVTKTRMLAVLPKLESLGIRWAVLDDRWFDAFGDWEPRDSAFPEDSIREVVDGYHARGLKLQLWWMPLAVETGRRLPRGTLQEASEIAARHPEWLVLDARGREARGVRGLSILCPAVPEVREHHRRLVRRFIGEWGFDGHKLDAVFSVPRCYNPVHHHGSPDDSLRAFRRLYEEIAAETRSLKPDAVIQICSCGTAPHHAWLPYLTQAVAADPWGSAQRRQRIKMYKALLGSSAAVSGDHAELAERASETGGEPPRGRDFASTLGLGGVPSTRFVWPEAPPGSEDVLLTPAKEALYRKWLELYRRTRLSEGTYRNLYVQGFDRPEGYCVEKDGRLYYAFFTDDPDDAFEGAVELRGLGGGRYRLEAYEAGHPLGFVTGPTARVPARFTGHLLLMASPEGT